MEFEYNDGGRSKYFKASNVGDCVTRAICNATGLDYKYVYDRLRELAKQESVKNHRGHKKSSVRDGVFKETWKLFLEEINWKRIKTMEMGSSKRVHLDDRELPSKGTYIVQVSKHLTCVRDGVIVDTYDCSRDGERMVYGYYRPMTPEELAEKQAELDAKATKQKLVEEARATKKAEQERIRAEEKKIKEAYKKKMAPYKKKLRALEKEMISKIAAIQK